MDDDSWRIPRDPEPERPRRKSAPDVAPPRRGRGGGRLWWVLTVIILLFVIVPSLLAEMITDWMWFTSQNLSEVYTTRLWLALGVFAASSLLAILFLWANWTMAWRLAAPSNLFPGQKEAIPRGVARGIALAASVVVGLFLALGAASEWSTILLFLNGGTFGQTDPLFNNDIGFYVFGLPFFRLLRGWAIVLVVVAAVGAVIVYAASTGLAEVIRQQNNPTTRRAGSTPDISFNLDPRVGAHLSILGAIFLVLVAVGYWLGRFDLLYSSRAVAYGAGYTDVNAKLPALNIMMGVAVIAAILLLVNLRVRAWKLLVGALGAWLLALVLINGLYPYIVQEFVVRPSELDRERPYIENNIKATRQAFGLDKFREREVPAVNSITPEQLDENRGVIEDIRLWDYRPLRDTFGQLQEIRTYYSFGEVDIDRYSLDGETRQVMLSAREMSTAELDAQVRTWQNQHLVYTHGYGAVAASVNEIIGEGLPRLLLRDVPPTSEFPELRLTRPEIYYGEQTGNYVFVNSGAQEFDYPLEAGTQFTTYQGKGGVALSSIFTKLLFAVRFGDGNVLLSNYITPETRVLFHREIHDAVRLLAPFLLYDEDPYLTIADGRLYWIQDAYTASDRYPYSQPLPSGINYIRNSVKVVIDAYEGTATFYVTDPSDPLVNAYRGIFPALFKDLDEMPASVRAHIRYPEDLLNVQASIYETYHMTDPQVFYSKEDKWAVPGGADDSNTLPLEAYYTMMQLPGDTEQRFMLILPFTPTNRDNMIAWMAANSDGDDYGIVDVIRYPKQQLVYGPRQIEARISQDPIISEQLTLWGQVGSRVQRGNLLTIPISNSVLYVEPLFLQADNSNFPELKRVIVVTGDRVGFGEDLDSALEAAMTGTVRVPIIDGDGATPGTTPVAGRTPQPLGTPASIGTAAELTRSALDHYERAQTALREGDWTTYGREIDAMKEDLDALALLTGVPTPVAPGASPSPAQTPLP